MNKQQIYRSRWKASIKGIPSFLLMRFFETWISKIWNFDFLKNQKSSWSEIRNIFLVLLVLYFRLKSKLAKMQRPQHFRFIYIDNSKMYMVRSSMSCFRWGCGCGNFIKTFNFFDSGSKIGFLLPSHCHF